MHEFGCPLAVLVLFPGKPQVCLIPCSLSFSGTSWSPTSTTPCRVRRSLSASQGGTWRKGVLGVTHIRNEACTKLLQASPVKLYVRADAAKVHVVGKGPEQATFAVVTVAQGPCWLPLINFIMVSVAAVAVGSIRIPLPLELPKTFRRTYHRPCGNVALSPSP